MTEVGEANNGLSETKRFGNCLNKCDDWRKKLIKIVEGNRNKPGPAQVGAISKAQK